MGDRLICITVLGPDHRGLLAEVTGAIMPLAVYHEDPKITFLPGGNISIVLCLRTDVSVHRVREALDEVPHEGLIVRAHELPELTEETKPEGGRFVLRIRTAGRPGVMAQFTKVVAGYGGMILDFGTRVGGGRISVLRVELEDHSPEHVDALRAALYSAAEAMGIGIKFYDATVGENEPLAGIH